MLITLHKPVQWCYLAVPKTATNTVRRLLYELGGYDKETFDRHYQETKGEELIKRFADYCWWATVRNPYSRAVSLWSEYKFQPIPTTSTPQFRRYFEIARKCSFKEALKNEEYLATGFWQGHTSMCAFLKLVPELDYHVRQETLHEDLSHLFKVYGQPPVPELLRARPGGYRRDSKTPHWTDHYDSECIDLVRSLCEDDFTYCLQRGLYTDEFHDAIDLG